MLFTSLYQRMMRWSRHRHASQWLGGVSFAESSFFPLPVDLMLAPMTLAEPARWWRFALIATVGSALGGVAGYLMGAYAYDEWVRPMLSASALGHMDTARTLIERWGVLIIFVAGFSPVPYKVFTFSAGIAHMAIIPFALASLIGRGSRFFLVCAIVRVAGPHLAARLQRHAETVGWTLAILLAAAIAYAATR